MLDFFTNFANTNNVIFPNTQAVDASGGTATDGTEFVANMINDSMWGWQQALLDYVGVSPSGLVESVSNGSQIVEAMASFSIPGIQIAAYWNDDPATLGIRALMLTGQGILRANYPELDAVVYCGDADNNAADAFYHADDAAGTTRNTAGVYLILPDARGRVVRGRDLTGSVDPDGAGAYLGSEQEDAFQAHGHELIGSGISPAGGTGTSHRGTDTGTTYNGKVTTEEATTGGPPRTGNETRVKSLLADMAITY